MFYLCLQVSLGLCRAQLVVATPCQPISFATTIQYIQQQQGHNSSRSHTNMQPTRTPFHHHIGQLSIPTACVLSAFFLALPLVHVLSLHILHILHDIAYPCSPAPGSVSCGGLSVTTLLSATLPSLQLLVHRIAAIRCLLPPNKTRGKAQWYILLQEAAPPLLCRPPLLTG